MLKMLTNIKLFKSNALLYILTLLLNLNILLNHNDSWMLSFYLGTNVKNQYQISSMYIGTYL